MESDGISSSIGNLACSNNRVFLQSRNTGGVRFPGRDIFFPHIHDDSPGLTIFDYGGHVIDGQDYNATNPDNKPGPISLQDSVLYLMQVLTTDATFGDIHLPVNERMACIVKYVDTSFMTPYVSPVVTHIPVTEAAPPTLYPNPAHDQVLLSSTDGPVVTASAISVYGRKEPLGVHGQSIDVSHLTPGVYLLEINTTRQQYHLKFIKL